MSPEMVIKGIILSEKAVQLSASKVYALKVDLRASKYDVRDALKQVFDVDAVQINTSVLRGRVSKKARAKGKGMVTVKHANFKKAFVRLKEGQELPVPTAGGASEEASVG